MKTFIITALILNLTSSLFLLFLFCSQNKFKKAIKENSFLILFENDVCVTYAYVCNNSNNDIPTGTIVYLTGAIKYLGKNYATIAQAKPKEKYASIYIVSRGIKKQEFGLIQKIKSKEQ